MKPKTAHLGQICRRACCGRSLAKQLGWAHEELEQGLDSPQQPRHHSRHSGLQLLHDSRRPQPPAFVHNLQPDASVSCPPLGASHAKLHCC